MFGEVVSEFASVRLPTSASYLGIYTRKIKENVKKKRIQSQKTVKENQKLMTKQHV